MEQIPSERKINWEEKSSEDSHDSAFEAASSLHAKIGMLEDKVSSKKSSVLHSKQSTSSPASSIKQMSKQSK